MTQTMLSSLAALPPLFKTALTLLWDLLRWLSIILFFCISPSCDPRPDASTVSGYYGPGAFLAWLITAIVTIANGEVKLALLSPRLIKPQPLKLPQCTNDCYTLGEFLDFKGPCEQCQQRDDPEDPRVEIGKRLSKLSLNPPFIATLLYPAIATVDMLSHLDIQITLDDQNARNSTTIGTARMEAGFAVFQTWWALSCVSAAISCLYMPWITKWRLFMPMMISCAGFVFFVVFGLGLRMSMIWFLKGSFFLILGLVSCFIHKTKGFPKRYTYDALFVVISSLAVIWLFMMSKLGCSVVVRPLYVNSGAKLSDLDQVASLATAAVLVAWDVLPGAKSLVTRLWSRVTH
jgi:hypothetical protein